MLKMPVLVIGIVLLCSSCFARGGISGELRTQFDLELSAVHKAVVNTLQAEKIIIKKNKIDAVTALVTGEYADETPLTIHCEQISGGVTAMTIQVGLFGNRVRSEALLKEIGTRFSR